jgi:thioredoxin reductase
LTAANSKEVAAFFLSCAFTIFSIMSEKLKGKRVCVIGAGCSGITAIKNLAQAGVENITCFEQNDQVGGNWIYSAKETHSSIYETTHIISSKKMSEYLDYPMPDDYPDYPSHRQVLAYFQSYAKSFGIEKYIRFNTKVASAKKIADEQWEIKLDNGESHIFDYLFVANGHHSVPRMPDFEGQFSGQIVHSHSYKNNKNFKDKKVLVVGIGNSGCDCAVETSRVAEFVAISARSPQYIIPKFMFGKPSDTFNDGLQWLPKFILAPLRKLSLKLYIGSYKKYGLKQPKFDPIASHPTMNSELLYKIRHGNIHPRSGIKKIDGKTVFFDDGKSDNFDIIITATGYKIATPFFDKNFINYEEADRIPLYMRVFHPEHPTLLFIGLFQPQGAIWPISDAQAKLAANYVVGKWKTPKNIQKLAERDSDYINKEFIKAKRHTIEVHFIPYLKSLLKEIPKNTAG